MVVCCFSAFLCWKSSFICFIPTNPSLLSLEHGWVLWWFLLVVSSFLRVSRKLWQGSFEPAYSRQLGVGVLGRVSNLWCRYLEDHTNSSSDFHSHKPSIDHWALLRLLCRFGAILIVLSGAFLSLCVFAFILWFFLVYLSAASLFSVFWMAVDVLKMLCFQWDGFVVDEALFGSLQIWSDWY